MLSFIISFEFIPDVILVCPDIIFLCLYKVYSNQIKEKLFSDLQRTDPNVLYLKKSLTYIKC